MEPKLQPELSDIIENIKRYCATNDDVHFVYGFLTYKPDPENEKCPDCGGDCGVPDETKSQFGAYGELDVIRDMLNNIRNNVEDNVDRNGFINL
jgi:hypothetical protein